MYLEVKRCDNQGFLKHISAKEKKKRQMKQMWKNLPKCLICVIAVWMDVHCPTHTAFVIFENFHNKNIS